MSYGKKLLWLEKFFYRIKNPFTRKSELQIPTSW
jgi:hypothetical protein